MPEEEPVSFKDSQMQHYTVFEAYRDKGEDVYAKLNNAGIDRDSFDIFIRSFKFEEDLEVWAKNRHDTVYQLVTSYKYCTNVGDLGPKRKEGDKQIPEGVYTMNKFNPASSYFLSLKVDYPNESDSVLSDRYSPGGMIFIHGGCNSVGCISITDEWIKELYVFCVEARHSGQGDIPIHIFPTRLTQENFTLLTKQYEDKSLHSFWRQLKNGYDLFEKNNELPEVEIDGKGQYFFR